MSSSQTQADQPNPTCPQCGGRLGSTVRGGVCARCVMSMAMEPTRNTLSTPLAEDVAAAFPQYDIEAELGRGGMGAVFRARHRQLDRTVAIKVLLPEHDEPELAERFSREARALASLQHPNIVGVQDVGQVGSLYYLVMDFVDGADLRQLIKAGELTVKDALTWVPQICDALQYAHDHGVVHRDIKPENVLIDQDGKVQIVDFGLAKLMNPDGRDLSLTRSVQGLGTPHYMAPEQVAGAAKVDHRADIYSLGVMLYELLTGELPLGRFAPPSRKSGTGSSLDNIVMKSLESDPGRRYQSASEVKADIGSVPLRGAGAIERYRRSFEEREDLDLEPQKKAIPIGKLFQRDRKQGDFLRLAATVAAIFVPWAQLSVVGQVRFGEYPDGLREQGPVWPLVAAGFAIYGVSIIRARGFKVSRPWTIVVLAIACAFSVTFLVAAMWQIEWQAEPGLFLINAALLGWLHEEVVEYRRLRREALEARRPTRRRPEPNPVHGGGSIPT